MADTGGGIRGFADDEVNDEQSGQGRPHDAARPRIRMLDIHALLAVPSAQWLIEGIMLVGTLVGLIGKPGSWKTFLALDWALSIATGELWNGRALLRGPVVYIAAEGANGIRKRVRAWCQFHGLDPAEVLDKRIFVIDHPVPFLDATHVEVLIQTIRDRVPGVALVVVDTLARCFVGGEENSAGEMGMFVDALDSIKSATGSTVLVVHHRGRTGENPRGSSAFDAALDTVVDSTASGTAVSVTCLKQKDEAPFDEIRLIGTEVELRDDASLQAETSCVLVSEVSEKCAHNSHTERQSAERAVCRAAWEVGENSEIASPTLVERSGLAPSTAYRVLNDLIAKDYFELVRETKPRIVRLTKQGVEFSRSQFSPIPTPGEEKSGTHIPNSHDEAPPKGASAENGKSRATPTKSRSERKTKDAEAAHA